MTLEEVTNQMAINNEIAVLGRLKEYLSYKEPDSDNRFFVAGDDIFTRKARLLQSVTNEGKSGIIAIETKYTDVLGQNEARNPIPAREATQRDGIKQLFDEDALEEIKLGKITLFKFRKLTCET